MKPLNRAARVAALIPKTGRVTLVPEHALALIGCGLVARPVFEHAHRGGEVIWSGALGALVALIALSTMLRLTRWQPWAQAAAGCSLCFIPIFFLSSDDPDWTTLAAGVVLITLALIEIGAIEAARDHDLHRGWRRSAARPGRGLRLVHSRNVDR
jgi:hypothetical protein